MDTLIDTLWHEFAVETEDHLLAVEPLLSRGDLERTEPDEIAQLFRSFHSIKGISRAMEVLGMESVAHHAENLLGLVRDGRVALTPKLADLLLQAVDALKQMRTRMMADRQDTAPDPALLARLGAAYAELGGAPEAPATEPPPVAAPAADPGGAALHEDPEMLGIFVEMVKLRGAELCAALSASAEERALAADAAETLEHAAEVMTFEALSESLLGVLEGLRAAGEGAVAGEARQELVSRLGDIRLQIELIAEITGQDAGAEEFAVALAARSGDDRAELAVELSYALEQLRGDLDGEDWAAVEAGAAPVARLARQLYSAVAAQSLVRLPQLLLLIEDVFSRAGLGEVAISHGLLDAAEEVLARLDLTTSAPLADCPEPEAAALTVRLRGLLAEEATADQAGGRSIGGVHLPAELASVLSGDNTAAFEQGLAEGLVPYALLLFLEKEPAIAERLIGWLTGETRAIANRTVLTGRESWFEFLILSPLAPAELSAALLALDPAKQCVRQVRRLTDSPDGEPLLEAAETLPAALSQPAARRATATAANVIRVRSEVIDAFLDEIGEMRAAVGALSHAARGGGGLAVLARSRQLAARLPAELRGEFAGVLQALHDRERLLLDAEQRISGIVGRVHQSALEFRVVPVEVIFNRFPRVVRDLAARQGKSIELSLEGRDVRIDKSMVEALADPLLHMVRNAVDHGIEPTEERRTAGKPERARLTLRASQRGAEIDIEIADDGRGLDAAAIRAKAIARGLVIPARAATLDDAEIFQCIFAAGLSTAVAVTETSGRGVGMDVVLTTVRRLNGDIAIRSERGRGTVFTLTLPVSAALQNALVVRVGDQSLAIPERYVAAVVEIEDGDVRRIGAGRSIVYRQAVLPLYDLGVLLGMSGPVDGEGARPAIIASSGRNLVGLEVAAVERRQELFLKDLHPLLAQFPGVGGASVLDDGRVVLVLDGDELMQLSARGIATADVPPREAAAAS